MVAMAKSNPQLDVLVLGLHPSAYLAAEMLYSGKPRASVIHATIPGETFPDRLVIVNPALFSLHKPLEKLRKKLDLRGASGLAFLSDDGKTQGQWRGKSTVACVGAAEAIRAQMAGLAKESGVKLLSPRSLNIISADEKGFEVEIDGGTLRPRAILLAGAISPESARPLALPDRFNIEVMKRYSLLRLPEDKWANLEPRPLVQMSLDLDGKLTWAWLLAGPGEIQLAVEQPLESVQSESSAAALMQKWAEVLRKHGILKPAGAIPLDRIETLDLPAAGALTREIVANRTLLFGPAGGFYSACLEDMYPNCWSAVFAVKAVREALSQTHLQDALQPYRQSWGTTLGEYLRGPQQNLRFLLPLVYRNPVMAQRMAESILLGKSVVR
jgi:hypothetical protein